MSEQETELKRTLSLPLLIFYGLGTIVGAGIYVLIGEIAGEAGAYLPYAFLLAGVTAAFTAFSYAELSARYPESAGAALYVEKAYRKSWLSQLVGWMVIFTGIVSAATIVSGLHGYLSVFIDTNPVFLKIAFTLFLMGIAAWGIKQSALLIMGITLLEIGGLVYVLSLGALSAPDIAPVIAEPTSVPATYSGLLFGCFLAFYAFIGFEDMVNVTEEVKNPKKALPAAILISVSVATALYMAVAFAVMELIPMSVLSEADAPLASLVERAGQSPHIITLISMVAVINGALVQIIMASRVLYGMARQKLLPVIFGSVHAKTQTPIVSTVFASGLVILFALLLPLKALAGLTSMTMLTIFILVNIGLMIVKKRDRKPDTFQVPFYIPIIGALLCGMILLLQFILG